MGILVQVKSQESRGYLILPGKPKILSIQGATVPEEVGHHYLFQLLRPFNDIPCIRALRSVGSHGTTSIAR